jgi:hypothetical protein
MEKLSKKWAVQSCNDNLIIMEHLVPLASRDEMFLRRNIKEKQQHEEF